MQNVQNGQIFSISVFQKLSIQKTFGHAVFKYLNFGILDQVCFRTSHFLLASRVL